MAGSVAAGAGVGRAGKQRVLGRQPARALADHPGWHLFLDADVAENTGAAHFDQHRAFGVLDEIQGEGDRTEFVAPAAVGAD